MIEKNSNQKNILILNWRDLWHPLSGGAEIMLHEHIKYWQKKGANITWFTSFYDGAMKEEIKEGIHFIRRGSQYSVHILFLWEYVVKRIPEFDVVLDCFHFIPFFSPLFIPRKKIIAVIHEVAGKVWFKNIMFPFSLFGYLIEPLFIRLYSKCTFITVSESTKYELIQIHVSAKNIFVIYNGIKRSKIIKKHSKSIHPLFIFLGRVSADKGIEDVIKAFSLIRKTHQNARLWIVGKEQNEEYLKSILQNIVDKETLHNIFTFGYVSEERKYELLQQSWLLLHASDKEGWGLSVIEAASMGVPTVGYNVAGLRDSIKNDITGLLTETQPESLAIATLTLLANENKFKKMKENAILFSQNFSWEKSGELSWKIINRL